MPSVKLIGWMKHNEKLYCKGDAYASLGDFIADWLNPKSSRYAYFGHKLMHINFVAGMRLSGLHEAVGNGKIYRAIRKEAVQDGR